MDDFISRRFLLAEYDRVHIGEPGKARKLIEDAPAVQQWKPASEPPKEDGKYLVRKLIFGSTSIIDVLSYAHDGQKACKYDLAGEKNIWYSYDSDMGYYTVDSVTHWMPLPEEPKE